AKGVNIPGVPATCKPVGPLPTQFFSETGPLFFEPLIQWRDAAWTAAVVLFVWPRNGVVFAVDFERAPAYPLRVPMRLAESTNIDRPQIVWLATLGNPFRQGLAGASACCNTEGVETGAHEIVAHLRCLAKDEISIRRECLGA